MGFFDDLATKLANLATFNPSIVVPVGKSSTGTPTPLEVGTNGLKVDASAAGSATETTLAAVLAKLIAAPATEASVAAILALTGGSRTATAPNVTTAAARLLEIARDGSARVNADIYDFIHQMHLVATTAAGQAAFVRTPPTFAFDGIWTDTDGVVVFGQPRGRPYLIADGLTFATPASWTTAGTDWTIAGNAATHVPGAGTDDLVGTMGSPLQVGKTYAVYVKGTKTAGTSLTAYCGTAAGTAITANGAFEFIQPLVCTGSSSCKLAASADFEGNVTAYQIYTRSPKLSALCYNPFAFTEIVGVASGLALTTLIVATSCDVHGLWRRVPGVADLG